MSEPTPPANGNSNSNLVCTACYLQSSGGKMSEAKAVCKGFSLCLDHLNQAHDALDDLPDVQPLPS